MLIDTVRRIETLMIIKKPFVSWHSPFNVLKLQRTKRTSEVIAENIVHFIRMSAEKSILKFSPSGYPTSAYFSVTELNCVFILVWMGFLEILAAFDNANFSTYCCWKCKFLCFTHLKDPQKHVRLISFSFQGGRDSYWLNKAKTNIETFLIWRCQKSIKGLIKDIMKDVFQY